MKKNKYKRKLIMIIIVINIFLLGIMKNNVVSGEYYSKFKNFVVLKWEIGTTSYGASVHRQVPANGKTSATFDNTTYEMSAKIDFESVKKWINENCVDKNGKIDNNKIDKTMGDLILKIQGEGDTYAENDEEKNNYMVLAEILGLIRNRILYDKSSEESLDDLFQRMFFDNGCKYPITSELYNDDGSINEEQSERAEKTKEELMSYNYAQIKEYLNTGGNIYFSSNDPDTKLIKGIDDNSSLSDSDIKEIKNKWAKVFVDAKASDANVEDYLETEIKAYKAERYYRDPSVTTSTSDGGIDDVISDSDSFVNSGTDDKISISNLQVFSRNIYNILLTIGIAVAVISGIIIGIKYMLGSVEEKADIKGLLIPYIAGCVIVFGSFAIWKLVVTILQGV